MLYDILKTFRGSQDGRFTETFVVGTTVDLSDHLASSVDPSWISPAGQKPTIKNKAIVEDGGQTGIFRRQRKGGSK